MKKFDKIYFPSSIAISCVLHCAALFLLYTHTPSFFAPKHSLHEPETETLNLADANFPERTKNLDEIFNHLVLLPPVSKENPFTLPCSEKNPELEKAPQDLLSLVETHISTEVSKSPLELSHELIYPSCEALMCSAEELETPKIALQFFPELHITENLPVIYLEDTLFKSTQTHALEEIASYPLDHTNVHLPTQSPSSASLLEVPYYTAALEPPSLFKITQVYTEGSLPGIETYALGPLIIAAETALKETPGIDSQLLISKNPKGEDFLFQVTLTPQFDMQEHHMERTLLFFIDRSSSVDKYQFNTFKKAVLKAIRTLQEKDTFNIYVVDGKTEALSTEPLTFSRKHLREAEDFLDKQLPGNLFSKANIYKECVKKLSSQTSQKACTALLFSGKNVIPQNQSRELVELYSQNNFSLYIAALGEQENLVNLDLLARSCGGSLIHAPTYTSFARLVAKKLHEMREPILIQAKLFAEHETAHSHIKISPFRHNALHNRMPYTITGTVSTLDNFLLRIEGIRDNQTILIRKTIPLSTIHPTQNDTLESSLSMHNALAHYSRFLRDGNKDSFKQAEDLYKLTVRTQ